MIEVCTCGEGHRTRLRESTCVFGVPLASVYKGGRRRRPAKAKVRPRRGSPTPTRSRTPPFLVGVGEEGRERGRRRKGAGLGGPRPTSWLPPLSPTKAH